MEKYLKLGSLGKGYHGSVHLVKNLENNELYAMKTILINSGVIDLNTITKEIEIMKTIHHKNIVKYYDSFIHKKGKLCIILEYADNGDLNKYINKYSSEGNLIPEEVIWEWFSQILNALNYLHQRKIIHRDIKSHNIFLTKSNNIKLGDFGLSKVLENSMDFALSSLGTPYYLSPEICQGKAYKYPSDVWMLGCLLYELVSLTKPFNAKTLPDLMKNIIGSDYAPINPTYSSQLREIIEQCLNKNPEKRPSTKDLITKKNIINKKKTLLDKKKPINTYSSKKSILKNTLVINTSIINDTNETKIDSLMSSVEMKRNRKKFESSGEKSEIKKCEKELEKCVTSGDSFTTEIHRRMSKPEKSSATLDSFFEKDHELNLVNRPLTKSKFASSKNVSSNNPFISKHKCSQIFINISSVQTPKNKPEYCVENIQIKRKKSGFFNNYNNDLFGTEEIIDKFQLRMNNQEISNSPVSEDFFKFSRNFLKNYIKSIIGSEIYEKILQIIEMEEDPEKFISSDYLKELCGCNYNKIAKILRVIYSSNQSPVSVFSPSVRSSISQMDNFC